ncbi:hypothetical protein D6856_13240 [Butyrivibrio sp. XB500-5]|uniref:hypothetical protein n=1 Tax=Butyrivibrio sp. XB500-5 TaxID=2364880 RepID=UPI000EA97235|nr:hypothetical protein [Butyrivibrio sp. XB500-5]RKM58707.1 hypothetical protein D6856_13240 [Butyrivibrio sp. XB500-5]
MSEEKKLIYDSTVNNKAWNPNSLFIDINAFNENRNNIAKAEEQLVLDKNAIQALNDINGTSCINMLIRNWNNVADTGDRFRNLGVNDLDAALIGQQKSFVDVDHANAKAVSTCKDVDIFKMCAEELRKSLPTDPFDDIGQYGANQMNMGAGTNVLGIGWIVGEDDDTYAFVRSFPGYEKKSDREIHDLLDDYTKHGCSFAASANVFMDQFKDRPEEFERVFGFSMLNKDGDLNYRKLILSFYLNSINKIYLNEANGVATFEEYYYQHEEEFMRKYPGHDLGDVRGVATGLLNAGVTAVTTDEEYHSIDNTADRIVHFGTEHNLDIDFNRIDPKLDASSAATKIQNALDNGYTVTFCAAGFDLEYENGDSCYKNIDHHAMTITGVERTKDKNGKEKIRYIVSTWGKKYYFDMDDNNHANKISEYRIYKIKKTPYETDRILSNMVSGLEIIKNNKVMGAFGNKAFKESCEALQARLAGMNKSAFDDIGKYGADHTDPVKEFGENKYRILEYIRNFHDPNYSEDQFNKLLNSISKNGTEVSSEVNSVLKMFSDNETEFNKKMPFTMKGIDGEINSDMLLIDYCLVTGAHCENGDSTPIERLKSYCKKRGIDMKVSSTKKPLEVDKVKKVTEHGGVVIRIIGSNNLTDTLGNPVDDEILTPQGYYPATITGVEEYKDTDGSLKNRYAVSLFGKKYYAGPEALASDNMISYITEPKK